MTALPSDRVGVIASSVLLAVAVFLLVFTYGRETALPMGDAVAELERRVASELEDAAPAQPLRGAIRIVVSGVRWQDGAGQPWLQADELSAMVDGSSLAGDRLVLDDVRLVRPDIRLRSSGDGSWNFESAFGAGGARAGDDGAAVDGLRVVLRDARVVDGAVRLALDDQVYRLAGLQARVPEARFAGAEPVIRIASLDARVSAGDGPAESLALRGAAIRPEGERVLFTAARLELRESVVTDVDGLWSSALPAPGIRARGLAPRVRFADLNVLFPAFPDSGVASFEWRVEPVGGALAVHLSGVDMRSRESRVAGGLTIVVGGEQPRLGPVDLQLDPVRVSFIEDLLGRSLPYSGTIAGTVTGSGELLNFDVDALLRTEGVEGAIDATLTGVLTLDGLTPTVRRFDLSLNETSLAALRGLLPGLPLAGQISGTIRFDGLPGEGPATLDATLAVAGGRILLEGSINLADPVEYDLSGRIEDVRMDLLLEPSAPPVALDSRFALVGQGTDLATADAALTLDGRFSGWRAGAADVVTVRAQLDDGTLGLDNLRMRLATLDLGAEGTWGLARPAAGGTIEYELSVGSLRPWAPYLPAGLDTGAGTLAAEGTLGGTLDTPTFVGTAETSELRYGGWAVAEAALRYDVVLTDSLPRVEASGVAMGLITPSFGTYARAELEVDMQRPGFSFELNADRTGGGVLQVLADGRMPAGEERDLVLRRAIVDLGEERWQLLSPAGIRWQGGIVYVDSLLISDTDGSGVVSLRGQVLPLTESDLAVRVEDLPMAEIQRLLGREPLVTGRLWAEGTLTGEGGVPTFDLDLRVDSAAAEGIRFSQLGAEIAFDGDQLEIDAIGVISEPGGSIDVDAVVPIELALEDTFDVGIGEAGAVRGEITFDAVPLAIIERVSEQVEETEGLLSGTVSLGGTAQDPLLSGRLDVTGGAATIVPLDRRYEDIRGTIILAGQRAMLDSLQVRSDGLAVLTGDVVFDELDNPVADVRVELAGFRPIGVEGEDDAAAWGVVTLSGPINSPVVSGNVRVDDGAIPIPTDGADDPLEIDVQDPGLPQDAVEIEDLPDSDAPAFGDLTIQGLVVEAGDDLWFVTDPARAELSGELTVFYSGGDVRIFGSLQGERGTFTLRAGTFLRRFEIEQATIRFFGTSDLNPAIDVTATRIVGGTAGDPVELVANVSGTLERPVLSMSSGEGVPIPESQLLSYLIFGRGDITSALGPAGAGEAPLGALGVFGAAQLSEYLGYAIQEEADLPIDYLQIRSLELGSPTDLIVTIGTEVADDVVLTLDVPFAQLSDLFSVGLEWRIDPEWSLELVWEPLVLRRALGTARLTDLLGGTATETRQLGIDLHRRWTY